MNVKHEKNHYQSKICTIISYGKEHGRTNDSDCDQEPLGLCASQRAAVQLKTEDHFIQMWS